MPSNKSKIKPKPKKTKLKSQIISFEAIGTSWQIDINGVNPNGNDLFVGVIMAKIDEFDLLLSRFRKDSLVTTMSQKADFYELPEYVMPMLDLYKELYDLSDGLMTPLIGQMLASAGYDAEYSFTEKELKSPPAFDDALEIKEFGLNVKKPSLLDFGAIGKGLLVDLLAQLLESFEIKDFFINAGGDMLRRSSSNDPLRIGLEHPDHTDQAVGVANLNNNSLCGSASNRRAWLNFHHIMNPKGMKREDSLKAVWATAGTTMLADAMTTALYFVEPAKLKLNYDFEYFIIQKDYSLEVSSGFPGKYFTSDNEREY
jgi:thiamine biosynthesis lipoprotein